MKLAVDAFNLAADRRGMGRIVRHTLERLARLNEAEIILVFRRRGEGQGIVPADLKREKADAVWYPWNGMRFAPHAPSIVTINDPFAFTYAHPNFVARWREQQPIRRAIRQADRIFTISQWGADELHRLFGVDRARMRVVHPALDEFWKPAHSSARDPYALFVAGPDPRKNARLLFEAFDAAFAQSLAAPTLVVAGTLSEADEAAFARMRAPHSRVRPSDEELRELYSGAHAVVVPSLAEGYGMPAVEAMACGAPVIAADAAALPEACAGAALLADPHSVEAWRDALERVFEDHVLRADLHERGLLRAQRIDPDGPAKALLDSARQLRASAR